MTDEIFMARLHGYAYGTQLLGYGNSPAPIGFKPIIAYFKNEDGTINRERTLNGESFIGINGVEREDLLRTA